MDLFLLLVRKWLKKQSNFVRSADKISDKNPKGAGRHEEPGSIHPIIVGVDEKLRNCCFIFC